MNRSESNFIISQYGMRVGAINFRDCIERMHFDEDLTDIELEAYEYMINELEETRS